MRVWGGLLAVLAAACLAPPALAGGWLPHPPDATWTYQWTDSVYNTTPTSERFTVADQAGATFTLQWTTEGLGNPAGAPESQGTISFEDTNAGLFNTSWQSSAPPANFPVLCPATQPECGNSLASTFYNVIWGARAPVLAEPLLQGTAWTAKGGAQNDVTSSNQYVGIHEVSVPAFAEPVAAAEVRSQITQTGALGDPYGSGVRTTWWVYGVGPVKVVFQHAGAADAPVTTAVLEGTNQTPAPAPPDTAFLPLRLGQHGTYSWTNTKHLKRREMESYVVDQAANGTAVVRVRSVSGPLKVAGAYQFTTRLDGITNVASSTRGAVDGKLAKLPPLGPASLPASGRRHFYTPFDLMTFGFNPVLPAYPAGGIAWSSDPDGRDFAVYGVNGTSRVVGMQPVKVPAGRFLALAVTSTLRQPGFPFGSGTRTMWFAPGRGLVKLVFHHGDGSTSVVQLQR
jgi:hypothetical protein